MPLTLKARLRFRDSRWRLDTTSFPQLWFDRARHLVALPIATAISLVVFSRFASAQPLRTVVFTGEQVPGISTTQRFSSLDVPVINNRSQIAFTGSSVDPNAPQKMIPGLWIASDSGPQLVVQGGNSLPGITAGQTIDHFLITAGVPFNDAGRTVFYGALVGSGVTNQNNTGLWTAVGTDVQLIARAGSIAPGSNATFQSFAGIQVANLNGLGQGVYLGQLSDNSRGLWQFDKNGSTLVARTTESFTQNPPQYFEGFSASSINDLGEITFWADVLDSRVQFALTSGIFTSTGGKILEVVREGDAAPALSAGAVFGTFSDTATPEINNAGQIAFTNRTSGGNSAWRYSNGALNLIAREGQSAPGAIPNTSFGAGTMTVHIDSLGDVLFSDSLVGLSGPSGDFGSWIWRSSSAQLDVVACPGQQAPDMGTGVVFTNIFQSGINARGQVSFFTRLSGPGVDSSNDDSLWVLSPNGRYKLIARAGDQIEVSPGDFRTVGNLSSIGTGNEEGNPRSLNDIGQLAFLATFTDGSQGIFVSSAAAVPEPNSMLLVLSGSFAMFLSNYRRYRPTSQQGGNTARIVRC